MLGHGHFPARDADRERLALGRSELDDVGEMRTDPSPSVMTSVNFGRLNESAGTLDFLPEIWKKID
jgi:hypothetical protein